MASPITTPSTGDGSGGGGARALSITPGARVLWSPLSDETIWKRLKDAGFDEESIKRRDKAALISYIAKLETEIFELHHNMGLLILERKELASLYEQIKTSAEAAELKHKHDKASHLSSLAEAKKREESLKKALGVEKECIASLEKTLHEMRAEYAEAKVAADCKSAEARNMIDDAQKKFMDAEAKLRAAEALEAEASLYHRAAERKLQEVEAREDDLSRRIGTFKIDCDAKEKEIGLERQSLSERRKVLQEEHERLLGGKTLLNQREDYISNKSQELNQLEKELEASKANIEKELRALNEEKSNLRLTMASLSQREEAVIERDALLNKREQELLVLQEKLANKESVEIRKVLADQEVALRTRKSEFEAELEMKRKLAEDEIEAKRRAWELREVDLSQREDLLREREHDLGVQSRALADKEKDVAEKMSYLDDKERSLHAAEKDLELRGALLHHEKEETNKRKLDIQKSLDSLEDKRKQVDCEKEKLETMKSETNELSVLEIKLKEEVDIVRAQKLELMAEEDKMKAERAKFESEWELIDEKREELHKEAERIVEEREAFLKLLKDERDNLRLEREAMRDQHKHDVESLNHEREEFMNKMVQERSEWLSKIQLEQADFLLGIEMQKRELETSIEKRREEVESYLQDNEKAFELEKNNELQHISSLREKAVKELEQVALEMKKLDTERMEICLDRERRGTEWAVLNKSIEELKDQTQKLEKQRELLRAEREEICAQIERLNNLEDLKLALDNMEVAEMQQSNMESSQRKISAIRHLKQCTSVQDVTNNGDGFDSPSVQRPGVSTPLNSARFSWIKRCTELIFKNSHEKPPMKREETLKSDEKSLTSNHEVSSLMSAGKLGSSNGYHGQKFKSTEISAKRQPTRYALGEPEVIVEVPPEDEITKGTCDIEPEIKDDTNEEITHAISEQAFRAGRKRRVEISRLDDCIDPLPGGRQNNKKRKQENVASFYEDADNHCVTSTEPSVIRDQHATGGAEDTNMLIVEKIINISEVTCEKTDTENLVSQETLGCLQNSEMISGQSITQDGGTNDHRSSRCMGHAVGPCDSGVSEILKEHAGHGIELNQGQGDLPKRGDLRVEYPDVAKSGGSEEGIENIGQRTRSKQKL